MRSTHRLYENNALESVALRGHDASMPKIQIAGLSARGAIAAAALLMFSCSAQHGRADGSGAVGESMFVGVAEHQLVVSSDGVDWRRYPLGTDQPTGKIALGAGIVILPLRRTVASPNQLPSYEVDTNEVLVITNANARIRTTLPVPISGVQWSGTEFIAYGVRGYSDAFLYRSNNGIDWQEVARPAGVSRFNVSVGGGGRVWISTRSSSDLQTPGALAYPEPPSADFFGNLSGVEAMVAGMFARGSFWLVGTRFDQLLQRPVLLIRRSASGELAETIELPRTLTAPVQLAYQESMRQQDAAIEDAGDYFAAGTTWLHSRDGHAWIEEPLPPTFAALPIPEGLNGSTTTTVSSLLAGDGVLLATVERCGNNPFEHAFVCRATNTRRDLAQLWHAIPFELQTVTFGQFAP